MRAAQVSVVGAGIAGLSSAIALSALEGVSVNVFERQAALSPVGAGIQLGPNAFAALYALDAKLFHAIVLKSLYPRALLMRDMDTGKILTHMALGNEVTRSFGMPYGMLHRADLQDALLAACQAQPNIKFHWKRETDKQIGASQTLTVRADGLWSSAAAAPSEAKVLALRGSYPVVNVAPDQVVVTVWVSPQRHMVSYPVRTPGGTAMQMNWVAFLSGKRYADAQAQLHIEPSTENHQSWLQALNPTHVASVFGGVCSEVGAELEQLQNTSAWRVFKGAIQPAKVWVKRAGASRSILIGDAAHAMLPHLAQGAALALEDSVALARYLKNDSPMDEALAGFVQERLARSHKAQRLAQRYGKIYHASGLVKVVRNVVLNTPSIAPQFGGLQWLYAHK